MEPLATWPCVFLYPATMDGFTTEIGKPSVTFVFGFADVYAPLALRHKL